MAKLAINPNELGDLVPKCTHEDNWPLRNMGPKYQEQLKEICHRTAAVRNRWKCDWLPMWDDAATEIGENVAAFENPAHVCAVHLSGGNVGVLRMDSVSGDCTLFLRLKRADWFAWADKHKVPRSAVRAFTKRVDRELGKKMLMDARAFKLELLSVHHPSVLALLCTMSRLNWLRLADEERDFPEVAACEKMGAFTLVALPPLPAEFEQCLGLLGHSAAFVKDNAGSDDDEVSLNTRSDAKPTDKAWGTISAGDQVVGSLAHLFEEGAAILHQLANPSLFARGLAEFNSAAPSHGRFLNKLQRGANAGPLPPLQPGDEASYLDPSDDEEPFAPALAAPALAAPALAAPALAAPAAVASKSKSKSKPKGSRAAGSTSRAAPIKRKRGSDSDEFSDSDEEASGSLSDTSEEEEEDGSSSSSSDDDDDDDDDSGGSGSGSDSGSGSGSGSGNTGPAARASVHKAATTTGAPLNSESDSDCPPPRASRKRARTEPAPAVPGVNGDQALLGVLAEMAKPCYEKLKQLDEDHGISGHTASSRQLSGDVELLQTARTPVALLAASLSINSTLAECLQTHHRQPDCCSIHYQNAHRLHQMAIQAKRFAEEMERTLAPPPRSGAQQG